MTWFVGIAAFMAGGTLIWFGREAIQKMVIGANALSVKLHAKADAITAAAKR